MLAKNQQILNPIQQMLIFEENKIFSLSDSIQMFSIVNAIHSYFSKKNISKNG